MLPIKKHEDLFLDLINLVQEPDSSFIKLEYEYLGHFFVIFDYRLASYSDFLKPSAIESRGIMFEVDEKGQFIQLLALPMPKFFNYKENPLTIGIDNHLVKQALIKEDGSLISHFILDDDILFKSKGSIFSEQAINAKKVATEEQLGVIRELHQDGYTVNFEYVSPNNRIVIPYDYDGIIALNARNRNTGLFLPHEELELAFNKKNVVSAHHNYNNMTLESFYNSIRERSDIEGYVVISECPETLNTHILKFKTDPYKEKHKLKDSCRTDTAEGRAALFSLTLTGAIDDLKESFNTDPLSIKAINTMEEHTVKFFNSELNKAENLLSQKTKTKKDFAMLAKKADIHPITFGVLMKAYDQSTESIYEKLRNSFIQQAKKITKNWSV